MPHMKKWRVAALIVRSRIINRGIDFTEDMDDFLTWIQQAEQAANIKFLGTVPTKWANVARIADTLAGRPTMMKEFPDFSLWLKEQPEVAVANPTQPEADLILWRIDSVDKIKGVFTIRWNN